MDTRILNRFSAQSSLIIFIIQVPIGIRGPCSGVLFMDALLSVKRDPVTYLGDITLAGRVWPVQFICQTDGWASPLKP
jgi:hypothetical protein